MHFCIMKLILFLLAILLPSLVSTQTCRKTCGSQIIKYPFGTGPGCGDPRFQPYVTCNQQVLTFATHTGCYPITAVDYQTEAIYISDPSISTCSCTQPSRGFSLDWNAPFSFHDDTVFALLDCSSAPTGAENSSFPTCDSQSAPVCDIFYSCRPITSRINNNNLPSSGCCVYTPVDLGPAFEMDLQKLRCNSYTAMYGFTGQDQADPQAWKYGIGLKYKFNFNNDYPEFCERCEKSNGVCGYSVLYKSFLCNCPGGFNSTADCFLGSWSTGVRILPRKTGFLVGMILGLSIILAML